MAEPAKKKTQFNSCWRCRAVFFARGHILGLGDRHMHNLLIDRRTAELIHIDLGIAFEQGRILPTPETVPFRLTRDIVDGFGPSGVEGTFRSSFEAAMRVLRSNKASLMTILEVLVHDPLYNWSMTPEKARRIQRGEKALPPPPANGASDTNGDKDDKRDVNKLAVRCLRRVSQKLEGFEEGHVMSVEGQVNSLILQARDPRNLHAIYYGWQAQL